MNKESLAILAKKITEQLVNQVPINSIFVQEKLEKVLADKLPDANLLTEASSGFFSSKKVKVNTDDDKAIANLAKNVMQEPEMIIRIKKDVISIPVMHEMYQHVLIIFNTNSNMQPTSNINEAILCNIRTS